MQEKLEALVFVSDKMSDAVWTDEEINILGSFTRHLALAIGNSLYAESIRTSRKKLSESERDASAGALIAGIDHEVKNPLHTMSLSLGTLQSHLKNPKFIESGAEKQKGIICRTMAGILEDVRLVNDIIEHLSNLAHRKPIKVEEDVMPLEVARKVVRELEGQPELSKHQVRLELPQELAFTCDPNVLYEILMNLTRNGLQAMEAPGILTVCGSETDEGHELKITDSGCGIPASSLAKIFDPFFSTKKQNAEPGKSGTGMGLFIVKEYMQAIGGSITVDSKVGAGTTFRLSFPGLAPKLKESAA